MHVIQCSRLVGRHGCVQVGMSGFRAGKREKEEPLHQYAGKMNLMKAGWGRGIQTQ